MDDIAVFPVVFPEINCQRISDNADQDQGCTAQQQTDKPVNESDTGCGRLRGGRNQVRRQESLLITAAAVVIMLPPVI